MGATNPTNPADLLSKSAPADLRDFLSCKTASLTLRNGSVGWLQLSGLVPDDYRGIIPDGISPSLTIQPGSAAGTATITLGLGPLFSISIPASVTNGQLSLDTSSLPTQGMRDNLQAAVQNLNNWFAANKKQLGPATFGANGLTLTKVPVATASSTPPPAPMVKISTVGVPGVDVAELFNVPSQDPPQATSAPGGGSTGSAGTSTGGSATASGGSGPQAQTVGGDSVGTVRTGSPSGSQIPPVRQPLAGPDDGTVPINEASLSQSTGGPTNEEPTPDEGGPHMLVQASPKDEAVRAEHFAALGLSEDSPAIPLDLHSDPQGPGPETPSDVEFAMPAPSRSLSITVSDGSSVVPDGVEPPTVDLVAPRAAADDRSPDEAPTPSGLTISPAPLPSPMSTEAQPAIGSGTGGESPTPGDSPERAFINSIAKSFDWNQPPSCAAESVLREAVGAWLTALGGLSTDAQPGVGSGTGFDPTEPSLDLVQPLPPTPPPNFMGVLDDEPAEGEEQRATDDDLGIATVPLGQPSQPAAPNFMGVLDDEPSTDSVGEAAPDEQPQPLDGATSGVTFQADDHADEAEVEPAAVVALEPDAGIATTAPAASRPSRTLVGSGVAVLVVVLVVALAFFGRGTGTTNLTGVTGGGTTVGGTTPTGVSGPSTQPATGGGTATSGVTATRPPLTTLPPSNAVIISFNEISFVQKALDFCHQPFAVHFDFTITGIAPGTPVVVKMTGRGTESAPQTFQATSGVKFGTAVVATPGAGVWTDMILAIDGKAPPSSGSTARSTIQC